MGLRCARFKLRYKTFKDISRPTRETGGGGTAQCGKCEAPMKWNLGFKKKWGTPTCSLVCPTFGISPSRLAMFTLAPCWIRSFTIWSMSRPLAVWSGVFPANVTLLTSAPRVIKYSTTWFFPASTAWCKAVRPLLESWEMLRVISYQVLLFNRVI